MCSTTRRHCQPSPQPCLGFPKTIIKGFSFSSFTIHTSLIYYNLYVMYLQSLYLVGYVFFFPNPTHPNFSLTASIRCSILLGIPHGLDGGQQAFSLVSHPIRPIVEQAIKKITHINDLACAHLPPAVLSARLDMIGENIVEVYGRCFGFCPDGC